MAKQPELEIESVFCKWLGRKARELAAQDKIKIIEVDDFPKNAPIHEDGSTVYDPMKPLVLFAVMLPNKTAIRTWAKVVRERNKLVSAAKGGF